MRKKMQKYTAAMMAAILSLSAAPAAVSAEETLNIVVIGDSISTGAQLESGEKSYVELLEDYTGVTVQNFAEEGSTTQDVLDQLADAKVKTALSNADVILVSAGIHDIMDPFMAKADEYMVKWGFAHFEDVFFANLADYNLTEYDLLGYNADLAAALNQNKETAKANMLTIGEQLSAYSNATVVVQNVYNAIDTIENVDELTDKRKQAYTSVCNMVTNRLNESVNAAVTEIAANYSYQVADVHAGFLGYAYKYTNLADLDLNPTAAGHAWIAGEVLAASGILKKGDANADKTIDSLDAAEVLVHAANIGAGGTGTLGKSTASVVDVTADMVTDAADAAKILVYAAELGAGGNPTWD